MRYYKTQDTKKVHGQVYMLNKKAFRNAKSEDSYCKRQAAAFTYSDT